MQTWGVWLYTGRGSPASDSCEEGLKESEIWIYMIDSSVSASPGLLHDLVVVGLVPKLVLLPQSLHRLLYCTDGKVDVQAQGTNIIRAGGAVSSAGSVALWCAQSFLCWVSWAPCLCWGSQWALSIFGQLLVVCAALIQSYMFSAIMITLKLESYVIAFPLLALPKMWCV